MIRNNSVIVLEKEDPKYKAPLYILDNDPFKNIDIGWVEQMIHLIDQYSAPHHNILDIFAGLGSTAIAAKILNRNAYMVEINKIRSDLINERWNNFHQELNTSKLTVFNSDCLYFLKNQKNLPPIHLSLTNIPYFSISNIKISSNNFNLYDVSNYDQYLNHIENCFIELRKHLVGGGTIIITSQNIRDNFGELLPISWDIAKILKKHYALFDERIFYYPNNQRKFPHSFHSNRQHEYIFIAKKYLTLQQCNDLNILISNLKDDKAIFKIFGSFNNFIQNDDYKHIGDLDLEIPYDIKNLELILSKISDKYKINIWSWNQLLNLEIFHLWNFKEVFKRHYLRIALIRDNDTIQIDLMFT